MRGIPFSCALCLAALSVPFNTFSQDYPNRPIRLIVAQGGDTHTWLSRTVSDIVASPRYIERIRKYGFIPKYEGPEDFARTILATRKIWQRVVRETGIKSE